MHRYTKKSWKPRFKVGDYASIAYVPHGSGFYKDERSKDPRQNRYRVRTTSRVGQQVEGWLYEDDLE